MTQPHLFILHILYGGLHVTTAQVSSYDQRPVTLKAQYVYYLVLQRKSLSVPALGEVLRLLPEN